MSVKHLPTVWSVSDAKSKLSEVLRCARENGPQFIGKRHHQYVVVSREVWDSKNGGGGRFTDWLMKHSPGVEIELPERGQGRSGFIPFSD